MGFNKDEGTLFNKDAYDLNATQLPDAIASYIGAALAPSVAAQYPPAQYPTPWWALTQMLTDSCMACPATAAAKQMAGLGMEVYVYSYVHVLALVADIIDAFKPLGCFHVSAGESLMMGAYAPATVWLLSLVSTAWGCRRWLCGQLSAAAAARLSSRCTGSLFPVLHLPLHPVHFSLARCRAPSW